jgi:hypothetical protein
LGGHPQPQVRILVELIPERPAPDRCAPASRLGLRFDVTLGSGWSVGGPHITDETAARKLRWDAREVPPRAARILVEQPWPGDELVAAYTGDGSLQEPPACWQRLPARDGALELPRVGDTRRTTHSVAPGNGPRVV